MISVSLSHFICRKSFTLALPQAKVFAAKFPAAMPALVIKREKLPAISAINDFLLKYITDYLYVWVRPAY